MDAVAVGIISLAVLLMMIIGGFHIAVSLMAMSIVGILLSTGDIGIAVNILSTTMFSTIREYIFGVIPLFVLMGLLANRSGASTELFDSANAILRGVRGSLAISTVAANAIFAAITGVSIASAAVFSKIAVPQMMRLGYDRKFAVGTVAGSSVLGMLIPPSVLMIVYGMLAETSIGKLFMAGFIPGLLLAGLYVLVIIGMGFYRPELVGHSKVTEEEGSRWPIILKPWAIFILVAVSLGGIWLGFFTPTEAGGIGAFGAFLLVVCKKKFSRQMMWETFMETGVTTGSVLILLIAAQMYSRMMAMSGFVGFLGTWVGGLELPAMFIITVFMLIFIALGCIIDSTSILLLTMPLMVPIVKAYQLDLVWFGIVSIVAIETGLLTPPFGMSCYTVKSALSSSGQSISLVDIFVGSAPFLIMMFICIGLLMAFPILVTYLPSLM